MYCCYESLQSFSISCVDLNIECITQILYAQNLSNYEGFVHACQAINGKKATIIIGNATSL